MVILPLAPTHEFKVGVIVIFELIAVEPELEAINEAIFPLPDTANPVAVFELAHAKLAPAGELLRFIALVLAPSQTVWLAGETKIGLGFTIMS